MKSIVITGASRGLGQAACMYFLQLGYKVYGISRSPIQNTHENFIGISKDLTANHLDTWMHEYFHSETDIIGLINFAGSTSPSVELPSLNSVKSTFEINFFSTYAAILGLVPSLKKNPQSTIINIGSIGGTCGFPNNPAYGASKAAIINLTQNLAIDLSRFDIRVNCVSPGYFRTDMTAKSFSDPEMRKIRENNTVLGRYGQPTELMGVLEFLLSPASSYITGQNFIVDGGWTAKGFVS
jgi:NAD(P)-dependent dehydrogenase (short-subunit alcohol dehydrogenase family)